MQSRRRHDNMGYSQVAWMKHKDSHTKSEMVHGAKKRKYTREEVRLHNSEDDVWIILGNRIYDVTDYLPYHPGGAGEILQAAGEDATPFFQEIHPWVNIGALLDKCFVGTVTDLPQGGGATVSAAAAAATAASAPTPASAEVFLKKDEWSSATLIAKEALTADVFLFTFEFPSNVTLGVEHAGQHAMLRLFHNDMEIVRPYTPISEPSQKGTVAFAIKIYPTGTFTSHLAKLKFGDTIDMKGPNGRISLTDGVLTWNKKPRKPDNLILLAGGTGITPMLQAMTAVAALPKERQCRVWLAFANHSKDDLFLKDAIQRLALGLKECHVLYAFSKATAAASDGSPQALASPTSSEGDTDTVPVVAHDVGMEDAKETNEVAEEASAGGGGGSVVSAVTAAPLATVPAPGAVAPGKTMQGRLSKQALHDFLPTPTADTCVYVCGPPSFLTAMDKALRELYYLADNIFLAD